MIRRFDFGTPIETQATVRPCAPCWETLPYFALSQSEARLSFTYPMTPDEMIFGLGETVRGINKRGHLYHSWNTDDGEHCEHKNSLYASHNFIIFYTPSRVLGLFVDDPGRVTFDLGYSDASQAVITSLSGDVRLYLIEGDSLKSVAKEFR